MGEFTVSVVERPAKRLYGLKIRTSMRTAQTDCPALWEKFYPSLAGFAADGACGGEGIYGVSVMIDENEFDYWSAVEMTPPADVSPALERMDLPAGRYARCGVPSLDRLSDAYMLMYGQWTKDQAEYSLDESSPCFELYPLNWGPEDAFAIYVPVKRR